VRLRTEQAQITSEQSDYNFQYGKMSFARLSGMSVIEDDVIPDTLPVIPYNAAAYDQLLSGFLAQKDPPTPEAFTARKLLEVEKLNYANTKTRLRPKMSFSTGVTQNVQHNLYGTIDTYQVTSLYAGFGVTWSIFDGFAAGAYQRNSLARKRQLETDYRVMTERLAQQAQMQVKQINFAARSMAISDRGYRDTDGGYKAKQDDFARGDASEADLSYARIGLYDAEINAYNNRIEFLGRIGDFLGTVVEDPVVANLSDK
jgi:outer membrane protein TolC